MAHNQSEQKYKFDMNKIITEYESKKGYREFYKYMFSIGTFGLGALYLWATTRVINQGEIGLRCDNKGNMTLLPPGRHSNFPWEYYPVDTQKLSDKHIKLKQYQIITVNTGEIAVTNKGGNLELLNPGQHLLSDASHVYNGRLISTKQETKKLEKVIVSTSDSVSLTIDADVRYQITDPQKALKLIHHIDETIKQIAEMKMSQIVRSHSLDQFSQATHHAFLTSEKTGVNELITQMTDLIRASLNELGIELLNIGIISYKVNDTSLAHELGQGAVIKSQIASKRAAAEQEAEILQIKTAAEVNATLSLAESQARARKIGGQATLEIANLFKDNLSAFDMYRWEQQSASIKNASNTSILFSQGDGAGTTKPSFSLNACPHNLF